ncbi:MAG: hypothetical protein WD200_04180 [Candidatus Andersenbacteria bacterium]
MIASRNEQVLRKVSERQSPGFYSSDGASLPTFLFYIWKEMQTSRAMGTGIPHLDGSQGCLSILLWNHPEENVEDEKRCRHHINRDGFKLGVYAAPGSSHPKMRSGSRQELELLGIRHGVFSSRSTLTQGVTRLRELNNLEKKVSPATVSLKNAKPNRVCGLRM